MAAAWDYEVGFQYWFNAGRKRTWQEVGDQFGMHKNTVRKRAERDDWKGRAEKLTVEVQVRTDREVAKRAATNNAELVQVADAILGTFARRLLPVIPDPNNPGAMIPNPDRLKPGDVSVREAIEIGKFKLLLTGQATSRSGNEPPEERATLEDIEAELALLDGEALTAEADAHDTAALRQRPMLALPPGE